MWRHNRIAVAKSNARRFPNQNAHHCDTCTTSSMSRAHGTYVAQSMANTAERTYVRFNNNKKLETPWSRRTQRREMIHGLRPLRRRKRRLHHRNSGTRTPRFLPSPLRRDDDFASASGGSRDRALFAQQQIHRRGGARDRTAFSVNATAPLRCAMSTSQVHAPVMPALGGFARVIHSSRSSPKFSSTRSVRSRPPTSAIHLPIGEARSGSAFDDAQVALDVTGAEHFAAIAAAPGA